MLTKWHVEHIERMLAEGKTPAQIALEDILTYTATIRLAQPKLEFAGPIMIEVATLVRRELREKLRDLCPVLSETYKMLDSSIEDEFVLANYDYKPSRTEN